MNDEKLNMQNTNSQTTFEKDDKNLNDLPSESEANDDEKTELFNEQEKENLTATIVSPLNGQTEGETTEDVNIEDKRDETLRLEGETYQDEEKDDENADAKGDEPSDTDKETEPSSLCETAKLFGVSEEKLVGEFNAYKASKLFSRINWLLIDPKIEGESLKRCIESAVLLGIESVTVFPINVELAKKYAAGRINVRVAVFYPYGAETLKTKVKTVKSMARLKISAIEMPVFLGELIKKGVQKSAKDWAKLKKKAGKTELIAVTDFDNLTEEEKSNVLAMLKRAGIEKLKTSTCVLSEGVKDLAPAIMPKSLENVKLEIAIKNPTAEDLLKAFRTGADTISSVDVENAVQDVKKLLGCK